MDHEICELWPPFSSYKSVPRVWISMFFKGDKSYLAGLSWLQINWQFEPFNHDQTCENETNKMALKFYSFDHNQIAPIDLLAWGQ